MRIAVSATPGRPGRESVIATRRLFARSCGLSSIQLSFLFDPSFSSPAVSVAFLLDVCAENDSVPGARFSALQSRGGTNHPTAVDPVIFCQRETDTLFCKFLLFESTTQILPCIFN